MIQLYDNASGHAVIDLTALTNQTITLSGVSTADLSAAHLQGVAGHFTDALGFEQSVDPEAESPDVVAQIGGDGDTLVATRDADRFSYSWDWGSQNRIEGFDPSEDSVDLQSFWTTSENIALYNNVQGDAVIDLTSLNNQTITLIDVSVEQLSDGDILI